LELTIEKLIFGGEGMARLPANERGRGKTVFAPGVLEGERIEASIIEERPGFARARVERLLESSPRRIEPDCPYFSRCGGCHYQYAQYEHQLEVKTTILKETLRRQGRIELDGEISLHSSSSWSYRNRARFQVRDAGGLKIGYFESGSHNVLAVERCPISSPLLNRALAAVWKVGRDGGIPNELREIEFFADAEDERLLVEQFLDAGTSAAERIRKGDAFSKVLREVLPEILSGAVFSQRRPAQGRRPEPVETPDWTFGNGELRYHAGSGSLRVSGGSFFQVNRFLIDKLLALATAGRTGELALDLYAGVGLFTVELAKSFRHVVAVESSQSSAADLQHNCPPNTKVVRASVEEYLGKKPARSRPDLVVVDPPRAGLGERVVRMLSKVGAPRITYVSCDPATLARDLAQLKAAAYRVDQVHLVDLFPQTYHLESVVQLVR
jgi:23S rRNA (uracil1939-C5)-methyltransferase